MYTNEVETKKKYKLPEIKKLTSTYMPGSHFMILGHQKVTLKNG